MFSRHNRAVALSQGQCMVKPDKIPSVRRESDFEFPRREAIGKGLKEGELAFFKGVGAQQVEHTLPNECLQTQQ